MQKTKIEWTDYTWNPIKGLCPVGCWYCYARRMYKRFKWNPEIRIAEQHPNMIFMPLYGRKKEIINRKVFVCSTFELFHPSVKKEWRDWIFDIIEYNNNLTFQILTKFPHNIGREMPDNVHLGVTVEKGDDDGWMRLYYLKQAKARLKFVSFEPLLRSLNTPMIVNTVEFDWFIFGRLTGYGNKYNPDKRWITPLVDYFTGYKKPVFLKDNLIHILGREYVMKYREFPKET